ncbi:putative DNA-binding protein (MmcQ/YjbR family) [Anaerosolibacter carboniphilus]|uniref:Putative DNA-binding protein (MmcQ/YjbR family) n=1 Tax=Anaerosolibacter carboniphilus TaxID=1417629 RepID=A0A841KWW4_9FIRM|nr:MmcQ/YjbR family DNA-binding protein [Anaerosolibacter carboniphilus]MBB6214665.1 putative DNA-binding protein (MmcQ/YjbR family) [Anaerosolibacter carboniphilus]
MNILDLKKYCLALNGAREDYPFGDDVLVIKVLSKMFALITFKDDELHLSLKCDPKLAEHFRQQYASVTPGYHLNKKHWNTIIMNDSVPEDEIIWMIHHSHELVLKSLTKAERQTLA